VAKETVTASWSQAHFDFGLSFVRPKQLLALHPLAPGSVSRLQADFIFQNEVRSNLRMKFVAIS